MGYTIYISGPMTGLPNRNREAFMDAEAQLKAVGYNVLNPIHNEPTDGSASRAHYLSLDLPMIQQSLAVALLDGWERSPGVDLEVHTAMELGLVVAPVEAFVSMGIEKQRERACYDAMIAGIVACTSESELDRGFFDKQIKKAFDLYHHGQVVQHDIEGKLALVVDDLRPESEGYAGSWLNDHPLRSPVTLKRDQASSSRVMPSAT